MPGKPQNDSRALRIESLAQRNDSPVFRDDSLAAPAGLQDNPWLDTRTLKSVNLQEFIKNRALKRQSCAPNSSRVLGDIEIIVEDRRNNEQEVQPRRPAPAACASLGSTPAEGTFVYPSFFFSEC